MLVTICPGVLLLMLCWPTLTVTNCHGAACHNSSRGCPSLYVQPMHVTICPPLRCPCRRCLTPLPITICPGAACQCLSRPPLPVTICPGPACHNLSRRCPSQFVRRCSSQFVRPDAARPGAA